MYRGFVLCVTTWDYQTSVLFSLWTYKVIICLLLATPNMGCGVINDSVLVNDMNLCLNKACVGAVKGLCCSCCELSLTLSPSIAEAKTED